MTFHRSMSPLKIKGWLLESSDRWISFSQFVSKFLLDDEFALWKDSIISTAKSVASPDEALDLHLLGIRALPAPVEANNVRITSSCGVFLRFQYILSLGVANLTKSEEFDLKMAFGKAVECGGVAIMKVQYVIRNEIRVGSKISFNSVFEQLLGCPGSVLVEKMREMYASGVMNKDHGRWLPALWRFLDPADWAPMLSRNLSSYFGDRSWTTFQPMTIISRSGTKYSVLAYFRVTYDEHGIPDGSLCAYLPYINPFCSPQ
jgi:hypothetical protein